MGSEILQIRAQIASAIAADRAVLEPLNAQLRARDGGEFPDARWMLERLMHTLEAHVGELDEHVRRLGGTGREDSRSSLAGELMSAAARSLKGRSTLRALRDYYTAVSLAHAQTLMLETDARARGYSSTAAMATRHREELASLLERIREMLPAAIKEEIEHARTAGKA